MVLINFVESVGFTRLPAPDQNELGHILPKQLQ
jgi:hypothetical protein